MGEAAINSSKSTERVQRPQGGVRSASGLKSEFEDAAREGSEAIQEISKFANEVFQQASTVLTEKVDQLRKQGEEALKSAETNIAKRPMAALGVALGVGLAVGLAATSFFRKSNS